MNHFLKICILILTCSLSLLSAKAEELDFSGFAKDRHKYIKEHFNVAHKYFTEASHYFISHGDTVNYLNSISYLADIEYRRGDFNSAFDLLWRDISLADKIENKLPLVEFNQMLGTLYELYGKDSLALSHFKSGLSIARTLDSSKLRNANCKLSCYLDVATQYNKMEQYDRALIYLDSCYMTEKRDKRLYYVDAMYAKVYFNLKRYDKAQKYLKGVTPYLTQKKSGYQSNTYFLRGEIKRELKDIYSAITCYNKALTSIDSLQTNLTLKPLVYERLAECYHLISNNSRAYQYMSKSKSLSDSLFNIQSQQNSKLFEIKNQYRDKIEQKEGVIALQSEMLELNAKARNRLILLVVIVSLSAVVIISVMRVAAKNKTLANKREAEQEKTQAILDLKNKELTENALQLIEKEQIVKEVLSSIEDRSPQLHRELKVKLQGGSSKIWDDFNLRFIQTNSTFYDNLCADHPDLTPTDLKHCILIHLNFDSKEMSHLLGISINSVHMARSRLRKKFNLKRDESLSAYLNSRKV